MKRGPYYISQERYGRWWVLFPGEGRVDHVAAFDSKAAAAAYAAELNARVRKHRHPPPER